MMEGASVPSTGPDATHPAIEVNPRARFEIMGAVLLGLFLTALDQTVVGTALPRIVTSLGGNDYYTWVVTIYLLTSTITVPFYGKLSDIYGRRPLLMIGISLFLVGSALSGLSQTMWQLILFRGLQGLGAGAVFPISLAVIGDLFTPAERGKYQGLFGAVFGLSFIIGPALGGFLTDAISWHWVFYVNLPVGLVALYTIWRLLPTLRRPGAAASLDYLGAAIFAVAIGFLLVGLTNKQTGDWTAPTVGGFIAIGLVLGAVFVLVEARAKEPIVPLDLWAIRTYSAALLATFFVSFGFFGAVIFLPRWFQVVQGSSAMASGYQLLPLLVGLIGGSVLSGQLVARTGRYKALVVGGLLIMTGGLVLMTQLRTDTSLPLLWAWMFVAGIGMGPTMAVFTIIVQNAVPFSKLGVATSNLTFFRQVGGSVGLAIAGTVFGNALKTELPNQLQPVFGQVLAKVPPALQGQAQAALQGFSGQNIDLNNLTGVGQSFGRTVISLAPGPFQPFLEPFKTSFDGAFNNAFSLAVGSTFAIGVITCAVAVVAALAMHELPLRTTFGPRRAEHGHAPVRPATAAD